VDVSLASAFVGQGLPGYTDRNRDFGFLLHGTFGRNSRFSWMGAVTNGDGGDGIRNVLDNRSDDNLAYSLRVNWAFLKPTGYEEGALRQMTHTWYGEVGAWAFHFADRRDKPHVNEGDITSGGADLALGFGGWSLSAAYSFEDVSKVGGGTSGKSDSWLGQVGYLIPETAVEVTVRISGYSLRFSPDKDVTEVAFGANYYLNGHGNKVSLDVSFLDATDLGSGITDLYAGYGDVLAGENSAILLRFQWQLAL
jgi:hypothetical protein